MFQKTRKWFVQSMVATAIAAGLAFTAQPTQACDHYRKACWVTVVEYQVKYVPYTKLIVRYDSCGHPYAVNKVFYRKEVVPVTRRVKVYR